MIRLNNYSIFGVLLLALIFAGCATVPYKVMPDYYPSQDKIHRIALYPLFYTKDGKEQRLFGMVFTEQFFTSVETMQTTRTLEFIEPDSTVSVFESKGIDIKGYRADIIKGSTFPIYKRLTPSDLQALSGEADALVFCDLLNYNEVGAGEEIAQAAAFGAAMGCLAAFAGAPTPYYTTPATEINKVSMKITLLDVNTGIPLWEYNPYFSASLTNEQRTIFAQNITQGFCRYFPLSADFQVESERR